MESAGNGASRRRLNVLTLDGGGVRGLSSLLILRELMTQINDSIRELRHSAEELQDVSFHEIFELVAGTSTGGLIAIMLGKLGMTPDECIAAYHDLSSEIFGVRHFRARFTGGFAPSKYSGSNLERCVCRLLERRNVAQDLPMHIATVEGPIACAVVCREHHNQSRYSDFKPDAVCICSHPCPEPLHCLVCEAARATTAAPTYFPFQKIDQRSFVDGGLKFNNPSHAIFDHYSKCISVAESRRASMATDTDISTANHGGLDFSAVRIINLGTGTKPDAAHPLPGLMANLVPPVIRMAAFLSKTLKDIAMDSENVAAIMKTTARVSKGSSINIQYKRFSANNGVCYVKMDKFKKLPVIESLTAAYLKTEEVQLELRQIAMEIAQEHVDHHYPSGTNRTSLSVPDSRLSRQQATASQEARDTYMQSVTESSRRYPESSTNTTTGSDNGSSQLQNTLTMETHTPHSLGLETSQSTVETQASIGLSVAPSGSSAGTSILREPSNEQMDPDSRSPDTIRIVKPIVDPSGQMAHSSTVAD